MFEFDSKLLACLPNDGHDLGIVRLNDARGEMMGHLVIESSRKDGPKLAVCGKVPR